MAAALVAEMENSLGEWRIFYVETEAVAVELRWCKAAAGAVHDAFLLRLSKRKMMTEFALPMSYES